MGDDTLDIDPSEVVDLDEVLKKVIRLGDVTSGLWGAHKKLEDSVDKMLDLMETYLPTGPLHWGTLSDADAASLLEKVADFVDLLQAVYLVPGTEFKIKPCWWRHPDVLWQLTALYAAFIDTYNPKEPPSTKQASFHEHILWPILLRIKSQQSQKPCSMTEHKEPEAPKAKRDPALAVRIRELRGESDPSEDGNSDDGAGRADSVGVRPDVDGLNDVNDTERANTHVDADEPDIDRADPSDDGSSSNELTAGG